MKKFLKIFFGIVTSGLLLLFIIIFTFFMVMDLHISEQDVRKQIDMESPMLQDYRQVLDYLDNYKTRNDIYPESIDLSGFNVHPEDFEKVEYSTPLNRQWFVFKIYPHKGPVEYYEYNGFIKHNEDGYNDGFLDNEYYYRVGDWNAVHFQYSTRY